MLPLPLMDQIVTLLWIILPFLMVGYGVKKISPALIRRAGRVKQQQEGNGLPNMLDKYNSAFEALSSITNGLSVQLVELNKEAKKAGVNIEGQEAYQMIIDQKEKADKYLKYFDNPLVRMADEYLFPIVKNQLPNLNKMVTKLVKGVGQ